MLLQDEPLIECPDSLCEAVIGAAIEVHRAFGPGLLESFYHEALGITLRSYSIPFRNEVEIRPIWQGIQMSLAYRADMVVDGCLVLELKSIDRLHPIHTSQLVTYQRLLRIKTGFLFNFNMPVLKDGIKRVSI